MFQKYATCYITVSNLRRYRQQWQNIYYYFIPFYLSSSQISLSFHLLVFIFSLISIFSIHLPQHADHQWPPLDASDHLSSLFRFKFFYFYFFLFSVHVFWLWFDGLVRMGKLAVGGFGGYGGGWVGFHRLWDMAVGGLRWADRWWVGRLVMGESVMANWWWCRSLFWSIFVFVFLFWWLWFGGWFGGDCGLILAFVVFFFFFPGDYGHNNFSGCCCCCDGWWWW